jgi:hypothetical protein
VTQFIYIFQEEKRYALFLQNFFDKSEAKKNLLIQKNYHKKGF